MDHATDLISDPVICQHLNEIVELISEPVPNGLELSKRYKLIFWISYFGFLHYGYQRIKKSLHTISILDLEEMKFTMHTVCYVLTPLQLKWHQVERAERFSH